MYTNADKSHDPTKRLGCQSNAFCAFQPGEEGEEDQRQWPEDESITKVLRGVLPALSTSTRIQIAKYKIYDDEMDSMWPCHSYKAWAYRVVSLHIPLRPLVQNAPHFETC